MTRNKKRIGSIAVDSETGLETYGVAKASHGKSIKSENKSNKSDQPSAEKFDPHAPTPNYGEGGPGVHSGQNLAGVADEYLRLFEHDPSEVILLETMRHPIGLVGIYGASILGIIAVWVLYGVLATDSTAASSVGVSNGAFVSIGALVVILLTTIISVIGLASGYVYNKSRLILTNQKVVYINYISLISRQISQLNIGEVEDVNVAQPSLIHRIFKTGNITLETAGEQHNYKFNNAKRAYEFAHRTIQAHEGTIREYGN